MAARTAAPAQVRKQSRAGAPDGAPTAAASARASAAPRIAGACSRGGQRFAARRWCGAWRARTTSICPTVRGTGAGGRISKKDILAAAIAGAPAPSPAAPAAGPSSATWASRLRGRPPAVPHVSLETAVPRERIYFGRYEVQPMSVMRQRIAEHMVLSKRVSPHVYSIDEADMTPHRSASATAPRTNSRSATRPSSPSCPFSCAPAPRPCARFPLVNASVDGTTSCCTAKSTSASPWPWTAA